MEKPRRLVYAAIALLTVIDAGLVARALSDDHQIAYLDESAGAPAGSGAGSSVGGKTANTVFLSLKRDMVVRAERGGCHSAESATVEVSRDGGRGFRSSPVTGLHEVLEVRAVTDRRITVVGLDASCGVVQFASPDRGTSWERIDGKPATWYLDPDRETRAVGSPAGQVSTRCIPRAVTKEHEGSERLLCLNGSVTESSTEGQSWHRLGRVNGAVDLVFLSPGGGLMLAARPGCGAAVMQSIDGGSNWSQLECLPGSAPLALAARDRIIAAQVGAHLHISRDGGSTWSEPAKG